MDFPKVEPWLGDHNYTLPEIDLDESTMTSTNQQDSDDMNTWTLNPLEGPLPSSWPSDEVTGFGHFEYLDTSSPLARVTSETSVDSASTAFGRATVSSTSTNNEETLCASSLLSTQENDPFLSVAFEKVKTDEPQDNRELLVVLQPEGDEVFEGAGGTAEDKIDVDLDFPNEIQVADIVPQVKRKYNKTGAITKKAKMVNFTAGSNKRRQPKRVPPLRTAVKAPMKRQSTAKQKQKKLVPDDEKDEAYWAYRERNTDAARKSRARKRCLGAAEDSYEQMLDAREMNEATKNGMRQVRAEMGSLLLKAFELGKGGGSGTTKK